MKLTLMRTEVATVAAAAVADDVTVIDSLPDSITPPAVLVAWGDPWLTPGSFCEWIATLEVLVVAARIEPGGQYERIEGLVTDLVSAFKDSQIPIRDITSPYPLQLGGVDYLSASINVIREIEE